MPLNKEEKEIIWKVFKHLEVHQTKLLIVKIYGCQM